MGNPSGPLGRNESAYRTAFTALCAVIRGQAEKADWSTFAERDWLALGVLAEQHGVAPLLHWHMEQAGWPELAPIELRRRMASTYYQGVAGSTLILGELRSLLSALQQAGVEVMVLKGAHLAWTLYPEASLRPMSDIDLLVRPEHLPAAESVLTECGYHPTQISVSERLDRQQGYHLHLSREGGKFPAVELHWELLAGKADQRRADAGWFWEHSEVFSLPGGIQARGLDPTANLLYLSAHLFLKHQGKSDRLLWLYDIALLMNRRVWDIDWPAVWKQAEALHWGGAVSIATDQAQHELGAILPLGAMGELVAEPRPVREFRNMSQAERSVANLQKLSLDGRLRAAWAALFPSREHMLRRYQPKPAWLWPLCYPLKWAGMAKQAAVLLFRST